MRGDDLHGVADNDQGALLAAAAGEPMGELVCRPEVLVTGPGQTSGLSRVEANA